jgi:hypothetical protein
MARSRRSSFCARRPRDEREETARRAWILARAARLKAATTEHEKQSLVLSRRQQLELEEPSAFVSLDEIEAWPREAGSGKLALGAVSYWW